jgi:toxin ParE1/3/4
MAHVIFSPDAEDDLFEISDRISRDNPTAADHWLNRLSDLCEKLADFPGMGEIRDGYGVAGCRSFTYGNYVVFFRAIATGIEVIRVLHGHRDLRNLD